MRVRRRKKQASHVAWFLVNGVWPVCFKLLLVRKVPGKPAGKENAHTLAGGSLSDLWTFLFLGV